MFANIGQVIYKEPQCIARVYIGSRVNNEHRNKIKKQLKRLKIPCQIQRLDGYEMRFERATKT